MIDKEQPVWVNFHNLNTENLKEIRDFVYLHYPFYAEEGFSQEGLQRVIKDCQNLYRRKQKEIQWLVNVWLKIVKPTLKKPRKLEKPGEINIEERAIQTFVVWLNGILLNSRWCIVVNDKNTLEREYFEDPDSGDALGVQASFAEFIEAILEGSDIKRCNRNECENIFLTRHRYFYCSDKCAKEAKRENDRQRQSDNMLCDLIELWLNLSENDEWLKQQAEDWEETISDVKKWLKGEGEEITASKLAEILEYVVEHDYTKSDKGYYKDKNNVEITFLNARSLGKKLSPAKKRLEEKSLVAKELEKRGILLEIEKKGPINYYRFMRIQSREIAHNTDTDEKDDMMKILSLPPEIGGILEAEIELKDPPPLFDTKILEELMKHAKPPIAVGYLVDEDDNVKEQKRKS